MPDLSGVRFLDQPEPTRLRQPIAVFGFGGWVDAGTAGTGAVRYLVNTLSARKIAEVDSEDFYSYTDTRPLSSIVGPGERAVQFPTPEFFAATLPQESERDLLLFVAPEPNLRWRRFADVLLDIVQERGATSVITFGSIFGAIHHRADVPLTGWATEPSLRETLLRHSISFTSYEGPTGFVTVLLDRARARGLPAGAIMGFSPSYIQGVPNPRVSYALLKAFSQVTGTPLPLADIERAGRVLLRQVDRLLQGQPELKEQVERMLSLMSVSEPSEPETASAEDPPEADDANVELPSPQALVSELEDFLKQLRQRGEGGSSGQEPAQGS